MLSFYIFYKHTKDRYKRYKISCMEKKKENYLAFCLDFAFNFCWPLSRLLSFMLAFESRIKLTNMESPSVNPWPEVAQQGWRTKLRFVKDFNSNLFVISSGVIAFGRSCLLAKINKGVW